MEIQVYQLIVPNKNSENINNGKCLLVNIGTAKSVGDEEFSLPIVETVWDLTNWDCWIREDDDDPMPEIIQKDGWIYTPTEHDRGHTNDDIFFEAGGVWWCADSIGWTVRKTKMGAVRHIFRHSEWIRWWLPANYTYLDIIQL